MEENLPPTEYKYKLKAEDFVKLFLASDEDFEERHSFLLENNENGIERKDGFTKLKNTEIEGEIKIWEETSDNYTRLICENVKIIEFSIHYSKQKTKLKSSQFQFNDCEINNLIFSGSNNIGRVNLNNSNLKNIYFHSCEIENILIENCIIDCISISESSLLSKFNSFSSNLGNLTIFESKTGCIGLNNSSTNDIDITGGTIDCFKIDSSSTGNITIVDLIAHNFSTGTSHTGDISLSDVKIDSFQIKNNCCSFTFQKSNISDFQLSQCLIPTFRFDSACEINGYITNGYFNEIDFRNTTIRVGSILSFSYSYVFSILAECFLMLGNLHFRRITKADKVFEYPTFEDISICELSEEFAKKITQRQKGQHDKLKKAYEEKCKNLSVAEPTIRFVLSSLGKTEFIDCPLSDFQLEFNNSKINDCFVSGNSLPNDVQIVKAENFSIIEESDSLTCHQQKASFYNQFKKIFEAQGDIYHATQFQAMWAEEQKKYLKLIRKEEKGWFTTTFSDLWVLRFNKLSNLYGESWPRAFAFLFITALIFYLLYLCTIHRLFNGNPIDYNLIGYYFEYLNPAHKLNFIEGNEKLNGLTVSVDFFGRVFVAYGIYQFIAAFRKHTKKQ